MNEPQSIGEILQSRLAVADTKELNPKSMVFHAPLIDLRIPDRLRQFSVTDSRCEGWSQQFERLKAMSCRGYVAGLLGACGTGKSQLGASLCKYAAWCGQKATMMEAMELCDSVKDSFGSSDARQVMYQFHRPGILVIDEVNTGLSEYDIRLIQRIVSRRYDTARQDTILISNETPEEFCRLVGDRVISRINDTGELVVCNWGSFRN